MLIKLGVDISRLHDTIRRILTKIEWIYASHNLEPVVTSTYEGNHSPGSFHYQNKAIDIGLAHRCPRERFFATATDWNSINKDIVSEIKSEIGDDYDVILESTCIHIEYDPD